MRSSLALVVTFIVTGCGSADSNSLWSDSSQPEGGGAGPSTGGSSTGGRPNGGSSNGGSTTIGPPIQLTSGPASLAGITSDGWAIFRDTDALRAVKVEERSRIELITERAGSVLIRGRAVFNWADIDWTTNLGELSVWTEGGTEELGQALYSEDLIAASELGSAIVYTSNTTADATDLMLLSSELGTSQTIIESMGRGSEETCGPKLGFVGERLFVGWCEVGSRAARLERFERVGETWRSTLIAEDALPDWSADVEGERIFYQSSAYAAYCSSDGEDYFIDSSVGRGFIMPDGSSVLYTVGDQLRRTALPQVDPVPVVTRGYSQPVGYDSRFDFALYSTTVTYDSGTQRDLFLVPTNEFNAEPVELVGEPVAELPRSTFTEDGKFVLYFTDRQPSGASLHVVETDGTERFVLENVVEAVAAYGATIVFTDNSSDPEKYPVVADLKLIDLERDTEPRMLEKQVLEARAFALADTGTKVVYARSGIDLDPEAPERDGLFFMTIR